MAFLRHDLPTSTHDAVLFDSEGGTHVRGRSTRVAQQPGGNSTLSLGWWGGADSLPAAATTTTGKRRVTNPNKENYPVGGARPNVFGTVAPAPAPVPAPVAGGTFAARKTESATPSDLGMWSAPVEPVQLPTQVQPTAAAAAHPSSSNSTSQPQQQQQQYSALYCVEGAQVRTRPARKVVAPPGGASSIIF